MYETDSLKLKYWFIFGHKVNGCNIAMAASPQAEPSNPCLQDCYEYIPDTWRANYAYR
jgi:hypothetical protein